MQSECAWCHAVLAVSAHHRAYGAYAARRGMQQVLTSESDQDPWCPVAVVPHRQGLEGRHAKRRMGTAGHG